MPDVFQNISEQAYNEYIKNRKSERGDLLVARVGAGIGETAVIDRDIEFAFYVSLGLIKPFKGFINSDYLAIVFNSPYGIRYSKGNISSKGGSAGNFNLGRIRSFLIPLPPLAEQERIVKKVKKLMKFCDELEMNIKQNIANADLLLQSALREALQRGVLQLADSQSISTYSIAG
jgi:type I restriction enzyme S subunit